MWGVWANQRRNHEGGAKGIPGREIGTKREVVVMRVYAEGHEHHESEQVGNDGRCRLGPTRRHAAAATGFLALRPL